MSKCHICGHYHWRVVYAHVKTKTEFTECYFAFSDFLAVIVRVHLNRERDAT